MVNFDVVTINWLFVLAAGAVAWILGAVWYSPVAFGQRWMRLAGVSEDQAQEGAGVGLVVALVLSILTALFLDIVLDFMGATTVLDGVIGGLLVWFGFLALPAVSSIFFEKRPPALFGLNQGYNAVSFLLMGIILAVWA